MSFRCICCGRQTSARFDQCPGCDEWGACIRNDPNEAPTPVITSRFATLGETKAHEPDRIRINKEWNEALNGGVPVGAEIICWGKPGGNKTTECLRMCACEPNSLYLNSEMPDESDGGSMLRMIADKAAIDVSHVRTSFVTNPRDAAAAIREARPRLVVADSVSALIGERLSPKTFREATDTIKAARRSVGAALVMIIHARRDGEIAAPGWLLHMCDVVVQLSPRYIMVPKNRFAAGPEIVKVARKRPKLRVVATA